MHFDLGSLVARRAVDRQKALNEMIPQVFIALVAVAITTVAIAITNQFVDLGGMLPLLATAVVAATGNIYAGLWCPIGVAVMTLVIGALFLKDTKDVDLVTGSGVARMTGKQA